MAQKGFSGKKRETFVSLKRVKQALWLIPPTWWSQGLTSSLLADGKTQRGARIQGEAARGKWVSRLRNGGQLSIRFPRLWPLSSGLQVQCLRVPVLQIYLPWEEPQPQPQGLQEPVWPAPRSLSFLPQAVLALLGLWWFGASEELTLSLEGLCLTTGKCLDPLWSWLLSLDTWEPPSLNGESSSGGALFRVPPSGLGAWGLGCTYVLGDHPSPGSQWPWPGQCSSTGLCWLLPSEAVKKGLKPN